MAGGIDGIFAAIVVSWVFCQSGGPVQDGKCGDEPANKVEMKILSGSGLCPEWDCSGDVTEVIRIERDGKVLVTVPASAVDQDTLDKLWKAMKPLYERPELMK